MGESFFFVWCCFLAFTDQFSHWAEGRLILSEELTPKVVITDGSVQNLFSLTAWPVEVMAKPVVPASSFHES